MTTDAPVLTESHAVGVSTPPVRETTLGGILREAADAHPDRIALVDGSPDPAARRRWTYRELHEEATSVAQALSTRFTPGERIAVWAPNSPEWVILEFGCAMAGLVIVTVNPGFRAGELSYVLTQSGAAGLFVVSDFRGNPMFATAMQVQPECRDLREIIRFDDWGDFVGTASEFRGELPEPTPDDAVMIQYTSGTTGFPKGAFLHHRGLTNNAAHFFDRMGLGEGSVMVGTMPLFHTAGSVMGVLGCVGSASTHVIVEAFEPGLVLALLDEYEAEAMVGVPTMLIAMLEHPTFADRDLSHLKGVCSGGSLVPDALVRRFEADLGAPFTIVFGQTECSPVATMTHPTDTIEDKAGTIGLPMPNVEVKIIDTETGATQPIGAIGEFCTRGYHVMRGYFEMAEQTAETIDDEGWLHTGDLCAMDSRGYCTVEGRLKDMIIRGGENIYPKEIEELLFQHAAVGEVAVVGLPDDTWGETVGAFIRPAPDHDVDKNTLFAYLREHLAPHKTPKQWFVIDEFPFTGSGKIQKYKLREQWQAGAFTEL
ncbi:MAG: AMP-binding protein [Ilumatobacter sp.]|nr:AMP-binding protein [Ilumatobacter sp.]